MFYSSKIDLGRTLCKQKKTTEKKLIFDREGLTN